jgi:hypothetical protein
VHGHALLLHQPFTCFLQTRNYAQCLRTDRCDPSTGHCIALSDPPELPPGVSYVAGALEDEQERAAEAADAARASQVEVGRLQAHLLAEEVAAGGLIFAVLAGGAVATALLLRRLRAQRAMIEPMLRLGRSFRPLDEGTEMARAPHPPATAARAVPTPATDSAQDSAA